MHSLSVKHLIVFLFVSAMLLILSCSSEKEPSGRVIEHPVPHLIAHYDRDHIPITRNYSIEHLETPGQKLTTLINFLNSPEDWIAEPLKIMVDASSIKIEEIGYHRILILDTENDQLFLYNLFNDKSELIAGSGQGPGELQYSYDLVQSGEFIYVSRIDMQLSRFKCVESGCSYDKMIDLKVQPISIASALEGLAITSGVVFNQGENLVKDSIINYKAVKVIDHEDGRVISEFGKIYDTKYVRVLSQFSRNGIVEYISELEQYIYANKWFPYLYVYNKNFELEETYQLENYTQNKFRFFPA